MDYQLIRDDEKFHKWHEYAPKDSQYMRYAESDPSLIAVGHKIDDTYYSFANARCSFMDAGADNFGDISSDDEFSKKYAKSHFLTYAILEYAICLDISWQVLWAYLQPSSFEYLVKNKYKEMEKECTSESVHSQLNCSIAQGAEGAKKAQVLKDYLTTFENDEDVKKIRSLYNSLKHQGMIHFEGLGENWSSMMMAVNGRKIPMICRKSYAMEEIEELLYSYHNKFKEYFNNLIDEIIPEEYLENKVGFGEYISTVLRMNHILDDNSKK